jgi:hypothetical protein
MGMMGLGWGIAVASFCVWAALYGVLQHGVSATLFGAAYARLGAGGDGEDAGASAAGRAYWDLSLLSSVHAVLVTVLGVRAAVRGGLWDNWPRVDVLATTPETHLVLQIMLGYIVHDSVWVFRYRRAWRKSAPMTLVHHALVVASFVQIIHMDFGHAFSMVGVMLEATTPLVNLRYFLDKADMKGTALYLVNGIGLTLGWFVVRIVIAGPVTFYPMYLSEELWGFSLWQSVTYVLPPALAFVLQVVWFRKLVRGALKVLRGGGGTELDTDKQATKQD